MQRNTEDNYTCSICGEHLFLEGNIHEDSLPVPKDDEFSAVHYSCEFDPQGEEELADHQAWITVK